jgi:hypothetical protein
MSYSTVIAEIDTILKTATDVGTKVYKYDRLETTEVGFKNAFKVGSVIKAWTITRARVESLPEASRVNHVMTTWIIRGYYSLGSSGATEDTFQGLIDNIRQVFRDDPRLNNSVLTSSPLQIDIIEPRMWGSILCHYAEMRLVTEEEESFT